MDSPLIQTSEDLQKIVPYQMNAVEAVQYGLISEKILHARTQRERNRDEFDGMNYEMAYLLNKRAAMSFLAPKKNDDEVRINTGTTEKRIELVQNELLALNFQEEIAAFDKDDNELEEASSVLTDIVRRTEQMEMAEDKDIFIIQELLTQPSVFVQENWVERQIPDRSSGKKRKMKTIRRCERNLLQGVQVYLGDVSIPDYRFNDQPYVCLYARMNYDEGKNQFGDLPRWKHVAKGSYWNLYPLQPNIYRKGSLTAEEIECWWYLNPHSNEYQLYINGIPQYEVGEPLPWDYDGYNMTMVSLKPLSGDWAYGKPLTASAKVLQALENETIRNLIRKFRQAIEPPQGVKGNKVYSRDIWNAGAMAQGVDKDMFSKLIDHDGVTQSELAMFDLIEKKINEFIGTSQTTPLQGKSSVTATEIMEAQKIAIKMLGLSVLAVMRLKNRLAMLRVKNVLSNYSKPIGKEVDPITKKIREMYARFTINNASFSDGRQGKRVIQVLNRGLSQDEKGALFAQENKAKSQGTNIEYKTINLPAFQELDAYFYVNVVAKERESSQLDKAMFSEKINQGMLISQITGLPINATKVTQDFERTWKEKDFFEKTPPQQVQGQPGQPGQPQQPGQPAGGPVSKPAQPPAPSVNTMLGNNA